MRYIRFHWKISIFSIDTPVNDNQVTANDDSVLTIVLLCYGFHVRTDCFCLYIA